MTFRSGLLAGIGVAILVGMAARFIWPRPADSKSAKPAPGASVAKIVKEDDLNTVTLTSEADKSLGIRTAPVEMKPVRRVRLYGGEIVAPVGQTVLVAAPLAGVLKTPDSGLPVAGSAVSRGQPIFSLLPLLSPDARTTMAAARVDAQGQVKNARTQQDAAKVALDRAKRLFEQEAGSRRLVEESQAAYDIAEKTLEAVEARLEILSRAVGEADSGTAAPIAITSPQNGLLRNITAMPNQSVPSGAALFEVVDLNTAWVRVAVYVGDLSEIDESATAEVGNLTARPGERMLPAKPVNAPPAANPLAATVDVIYEVANGDGHFLPGQRVGASIQLRGESTNLTIPWSAVVHDIHGGTWAYEQTAPRTFVRRRITVRYVVDGVATVAAGLQEGKLIVAEGAQELFGAETGFSK